MSLNTSPTDSGDSKRGLVGALARTRVPEERSWSSESDQNEANTVSNYKNTSGYAVSRLRLCIFNIQYEV